MKKIHIVVFLGFILFGSNMVNAAQTGTLHSDEEDVMLAEDMETKIDQAINVLKVVKSEMRNLSNEEKILKQQDDPSSTVEEKAGNLGKKINALIEVWQKVTKSLKEKSGMPASDSTEIDGEQLKKNISTKIDTAMTTMLAIKKEMDKTE